MPRLCMFVVSVCACAVALIGAGGTGLAGSDWSILSTAETTRTVGSAPQGGGPGQSCPVTLKVIPWENACQQTGSGPETPCGKCAACPSSGSGPCWGQCSIPGGQGYLVDDSSGTSTGVRWINCNQAPMSSTFNTYPCNTPTAVQGQCTCSMPPLPACSMNRLCRHESTYVGCGS
jgi:hypothetical protein